MHSPSSRRNFLAAGLALPAAANAAYQAQSPPAAPVAKPAPAAGAALRYRKLGNTNLKVTELGFGCMITSDGSVIERAADLGINYFDTARGYQGGNNERMVGAALKSRRKNIILSSKTHAATTQAALADLDTSLKELGTDYLDIWYLHARTRADEITDELVAALQMAKRAGKIRFAGVSTHGGQPDVIDGAIERGLIDVVLAGYNFSVDAPVAEAIAKAHKHGIGVVAMKVMAGGFRRVRPGDPLREKLQREGAMLAALKWALKDPNIDTTVPSMTDMEQLDENLKAMSSGFGASDEKVLARQLEYIRPLYCRMCGECDGRCPQGVPVADVLRFLTYAEGYGQFALGRERFRELPEKAAAVRCAECPGCTIQCPHGVRVADRLIRAQELFA